MTGREWQQFLDQHVGGLKWVNVPQNISLTLRKKLQKKFITELRMGDETIIKNVTQILDAIEN